MHAGWNISLFHYRNHGAGKRILSHAMRPPCPRKTNRLLLDIGKVLAGIQVPPKDAEQFGEYLKNLRYPYVEETENEVYRRFLRG